MVAAGVTNVAASVHARLLNHAHQSGDDFQLLLKRYAGERFLFRLGVSAHRDRLVLKGGTLHVVWGGPAYRPTRDLDFAAIGHGNDAWVDATVREICDVPVAEDGIVFDVSTLRTAPIRDDAEYDGLRAKFLARLGNTKISMQVDVGFGDTIHPRSIDAEFPVLLDAPAPHILTYPTESVISEKLHAMVVRGETNSRYKDFYDIHALASRFSFDGSVLATAISATFARRNASIEELPAALTPAFFTDEARAAQWRAYLDRNRLGGVSSDFAAIGERVAGFLGPVWRAVSSGDSFAEMWSVDGFWRVR